MTPFEFLGFVPTPNEKHLGIAAVKLYGKLILRYKIVQTKDGTSTFPAASSYKITDVGGERYIPAFILDSNSENESLMAFIKTNMKNLATASNSAQNRPTNSQNNQGIPAQPNQQQSNTMAQERGNQFVSNEQLPF